jgi:hypothetical protein
MLAGYRKNDRRQWSVSEAIAREVGHVGLADRIALAWQGDPPMPRRECELLGLEPDKLYAGELVGTGQFALGTYPEVSSKQLTVLQRILGVLGP